MDKASSEEDSLRALHSLEETGADEFISNYEKGIYTSVTREFDDTGIIFSGGQQQKLALSRVYAKDSDIIILDEPSSALDPIAERDMYDHMLKASEGKTVILISHRLASAQSADKIFVMDNGEIVEWGNHDELMTQGGKYYDMYTKQARNYN
jgi:ATP-binding cassette subfamily B protein